MKPKKSELAEYISAKIGKIQHLKTQKDIATDLRPMFPPAYWRIRGLIDVSPDFGPPGWRISRGSTHGGPDAP